MPAHLYASGLFHFLHVVLWAIMIGASAGLVSFLLRSRSETKHRLGKAAYSWAFLIGIFMLLFAFNGLATESVFVHPVPLSNGLVVFNIILSVCRDISVLVMLYFARHYFQAANDDPQKVTGHRR